MNLKLLTFNIHHGKGIDKKLDLDRIIRIISNANADIIGLNEVDKQFSKRSNFMDQAKYIANALNMQYVFGPAIKIEKEKGIRQYGNALMTRYPIISSKNYPFDFLPRVVEDRALLEVKVKAGNQDLSAYVTHLSFAPFLHRKQTTFILNHIKKQQTLSMIMGDWNMNPYSKSWRYVVSQLKDTWIDSRNPDQGYTYPSNSPQKRLDYIFVSKEFKVSDVKVITNNHLTSDHLPLQTTIKL